MCARAIWNPWGTWPRQRRGRVVRAGAVALALFLVLPPLPTQGEAGPADAAALALSEWMPVAPPGALEASAEWVELFAESAGSLAGWKITDNDGDDDFVFGPGLTSEGERIVIANGAQAPEGTATGARVLFMNKTSWTWDNTGDDLVLVAPGGATAARWTFGSGTAIDGLAGATRSGSRWRLTSRRRAQVWSWKGGRLPRLGRRPARSTRPSRRGHGQGFRSRASSTSAARPRSSCATSSRGRSSPLGGRWATPSSRSRSSPARWPPADVSAGTHPSPPPCSGG